jgi:glycosyltransferase involved in cell wall biosynthesis
MSEPVASPSISAFFPCYNDAPTIGGLVRDADCQLRQVTDDYEIIVVNDGSRDDSARVLAALQAELPALKVITHEVNRGYGGALRSGFAAASRDLVFYTDGDGQYDVKELPILLMLMTDDTHFVNGIKMARGDAAYRVHAGNVHKFLMRWSFWLPVIDVDCDFRLIRRAVLERVVLRSNSGSICVELIKDAQRAGAQFREVSVHHYPRQFGESQFFKPGRIFKTYVDLIRMWVELMIVAKFRPHPATLRP